MRPALGSHFVRPVSIGIMVSEAHTDHIRREAQKFRPPERCFKDISGTSVIVSDDCVFLTEEYSKNTTGDTFSVEIKPKQGLFLKMLQRYIWNFSKTCTEFLHKASFTLTYRLAFSQKC